MDLKEKIRVIEGFPKEGISFKDITTLVADGEAFKESIDRIAEHFLKINRFCSIFPKELTSNQLLAIIQPKIVHRIQNSKLKGGIFYDRYHAAPLLHEVQTHHTGLCSRGAGHQQLHPAL